MSVAPSAQTSSFSLQPLAPLSVEQEGPFNGFYVTYDAHLISDQIILTRITNDERYLRRVIKKFHNYASITQGFYCRVQARRKRGLYSRAINISTGTEKERHDDEHGKLRGQIEQLKTSLEHAQMLRRRKMDREELNQMIQALENDMMAIRSEHDTQNRTIQSQKTALETIISDLGALRSMGKDTADIPASLLASPRQTPTLDGSGVEDMAETRITTPTTKTEDGEKEEGEADKAASQDIEMGEVEEEDKNTKNKKKTREDMEEGEATDASSELSDPPDDD
ncbi:hypothetical protein F5146DRAFT_1000996 [Armillaria mellea]|nr:hypothetical protein F5146DRAFT_1000996 [Armillaria mellea]